MRLKGAYQDIKFILKAPVHISKISKIVKEKSYYPTKKRHSDSRMFFDNLLWLIKNKEINYYYNSWGLDIKNWRNSNDFLPKEHFKIERDFGNSCQKEALDYNYIAMLRDKYIFSSYLSQVIGEDKVVPTLALYSNEEVYIPDERKYISLDDFFEKDLKVFCKINGGERSEGLFLIEKKRGSYYLNNNKTSLLEIKSKIKNAKFIFQEVIEQHNSLKIINSQSINSIRITTIRGASGKINIFNAFLRLGSTKDSFVDNVSAGGLGVGIDDDGILEKYGFYSECFGTKVERHPISDIVFDGYQLPYWSEIRGLVEKAHKQFYHIQSIGWDVAITPNGPILIEGNDNWATDFSQTTEGGLKKDGINLKIAKGLIFYKLF